MDNRVALLIDSENVSDIYIEDIIKEIPKYGKLVIARFYGDINRISDKWRDKALNYAIKPYHQYNIASGKNAADMDMALDALSIKYDNKADTFFIVSSDSDFTPLAIKLKELGATVIGIGDENKVTKAFRSACSEFKYFQYFDKEDDNDLSSKDNDGLRKTIENIIIEHGENNKMQLSRVGDILINTYSDFDPRKYGSSTLSALVQKLNFKTITDNTTTFIEYDSNIKLEDIKNFVESLLKGKRTGLSIASVKASIEEEFPGFNYKHFGVSQFSLLLKQFGYKTKNNKVTK
ncbi:MAG TPA: NYN domain-containing protein [Acholeplasmataceae bacterium]|nr:NYN domain-containing protein [Acholeplasmataceae bacterium]